MNYCSSNTRLFIIEAPVTMALRGCGLAFMILISCIRRTVNYSCRQYFISP